MTSETDFISQPRTEGPAETPHQEVSSSPPAAAISDRFPWMTAAILIMLVAVYVVEVKFGVGDWQDDIQRRHAHLFAFGALSRIWILNLGEWYRIFSAPFLHGNFQHLLMNAALLGIAGYLFEKLIGWAWFGAIFAAGAISGSLLALWLNPENMVSVGASGAITALFAAMLIASFRFPQGSTRTKLRLWAIVILLTSLLPLASAQNGIVIDYVVHFGGAIGGAVIGLLALALWPSANPHPRLQMVALAVATMSFAGVAYSAVSVGQNYAVSELRAALPDRPQIPATDDEIRAQIVELVDRYPRDPRLRMMYANMQLQKRDMASAERELRAGLLEEHIWNRIFPPEMSHQIHTLLAVVLADTGRMNEAKATAKAACIGVTNGNFRAALNQKKLCVN